ncbi:MAG: metalloregulator ArsR/SmtB family transcription factor [Patescibacteria group bacterium]|jgi:DNA-binding transcriptional ArsR family regulator
MDKARFTVYTLIIKQSFKYLTMLSKNEIQKKRKLFSQTDKNVVVAFKALSDVNRYRIFRILTEQPKLSVSDIAQILELSLPLISQHIKILEHANLLQKERYGKKVFPKLEYANPFVKIIIKTTRVMAK